MRVLFLIIVHLIFACGLAQASIIDAPHNETSSITCSDCHNYSLWWQFSPVQSGTDLRVEKANALCLSCHGQSGPEVSVINHSSASLGSKHRVDIGDWSRACVDCHDPHFQAQLNWYQSVPDTDLFLVSGSLAAGTLSITGAGTKASPYLTTFSYQDINVNAPGWDNATTPWAAKTSTDRGLILVISQTNLSNTYEVNSVNDANSTITVKGVIDSAYNESGVSFGLIYGQLIRDKIKVSGSNSDVKFFNSKDGFIDSTANNDGICQVCHTQTRHFRNDGTVNAGSYSLDHSSLASVNCMPCHAHTNGFAHGGGTGTGCGTATECHGTQDSHPAHVDPAGMVAAQCSRCHDTNSFPNFNKDKATLCAECHDNGAGVGVIPPAWGTSPSPQCSECHATAPTTGSHTKHLANPGVACNDCHESTMQSVTAPSQHLDGDIDVYDSSAGDLGYPINKGKGTAYSSCSTASCHDDGTGNTVVTPVWGQVATNCAACHAAVPDSGSHSKHLVDTNYSKPLCSNCHKGAVQESTPPDQHLDSNIDVYYSDVGDLGYPANKSKNSSYGSCDSSYCHSSGQSTTNGSSSEPTFATATWGVTNGAACGTCHKVSEEEGLTSGSHAAHLGTVGVNGCADCHTGAANDATAYNSTNHVNGLISVDSALTYTKGGTPGNGYGTCSTASCHDDGTGIPSETPAWGTSPAQCSECHPAAPITGSHQKHVATTTFKKAVCANCHDNAVQGSIAPNQHLDGNLDIFNASVGDLGYPQDVAKGGTPYNSCATAYCHSSGQSLDGASATPVYAIPTWGTTVACGDCHKTTTGTTLGAIDTGSHTKHINAIAGGLVNGCGDCHTDAANDGSNYDSSNHADGIISVADGLNYSKSGTPGNGYGTCSTVVCHGAIEPTWGSNASDIHDFFNKTTICEDCHTSINSISGRLNLHPACTTCHSSVKSDVVAAITEGAGGSAIECATCHNNSDDSADSHGTNPEAVAAVHDFFNADPNCSSCHTTINTVAGRIGLHPDCTTCHNSVKEDVVAAIAAGRANTAVNCSTCHNGTEGSATNNHGTTPEDAAEVHDYFNADPNCSSCHTTINTSSGRLSLHPACLTCHSSGKADVIAAISTGRGNTAVNCSTCHNGSDGSADSHGTDPGDVAGVHDYFNKTDICATCHSIETTAQRLSLHPACITCHSSGKADVIAAITTGRGNTAVNCSTCHNGSEGSADSHGTDPGDVATVHDYFNESASCAGCHVTGTAAQRISLHPDCTTCHSSSQTDVVAAIALGRSNIAVECSTCHNGTEEGAYSHGITADDVAAVHNKYNLDANCDSCHTIDPASQRISLHPLCSTCHGSIKSDVIAAITIGRNNTDINCSTCHNGSSGSADTHHVPSQDCTQCHGVDSAARLHNKLNVTSICADCHAVENAYKIINDTHTFCPTCHDSSKEDVVATIATGKSGVDVECSSCHNGSVGSADSHGTTPDSVASIHDYFNATSTCESCHTIDTALQRINLHPECATCHGSANTDILDTITAGRNNTAIECISCHTGSSYNDPMDHFNAAHEAHLRAPRGPNIQCSDCHDTENFPSFADGQDLANTTVCNTCHSPGGTYDGVNDASVGAKANWQSGIYEADYNLKSGKDKWCATCHDEVPSEIGGISAPNVIGDEDGSYKYGSGWGYYKTGHGLAADENYPSKGGIETLAGRAIECASCHDLSTAHVDGDSRTFDCGEDRTTCSPDIDYSTSYRLKLVDGLDPMEIPKTGNWVNNPNNADQFRLCAQCHSSEPFTDSANLNTNFANWNGGVYRNQHVNHLYPFHIVYPADYTFVKGADNKIIHNSRATCVTCHNVHGSTNLAMVRDGKLIDREPGLMVWYANEDLVQFDFSINPPKPENVPLSASTGLIWYRFSTGNVCAGCHGGGMTAQYRCSDDGEGNPDCTSFVPPIQEGSMQLPVLEWTGENSYVNDGVAPDNAESGSEFTFRINYSDINNDAPATIQLWIDKDDNGVYGSDEKIDMSGEDSRDTAYLDGKIYSVSIPLVKAGDNTLTYKFHAVGGGDTVQLPAAGDLSVSISNNLPVLSWTGESYFTADGVHPNNGGQGADYEFRINYTDADNECAASGSNSIQVWVDENDNGYEPGEKHNLIEVNAADADCTDGKMYQLSRALSVPGSHNYRFYATDGLNSVTGETGPVSNNTVTVEATVNNPPQIDWYANTCVTKGVKPALGAAGEEFEFAIKYSDPDGCPASGEIQVWIDLDGNGYSVSEQHDMIEADPADTDCTDGKVYLYTTAISSVGAYNYRFYANDDSDDAYGEATTENTVEAIDAVAIHAGESIQAVIRWDMTILVYEGTYTENLSYTTGQGNNSNVTLQSVCGPDVTTIEAPVDIVSTIYIQGVSNPVIDGFTITGGDSQGILLNGAVLVKNSIIENNGRGITSLTTSSRVTVEDSIIRNNVNIGSGGGVYFNSGGPHSITGSVISNNQSITGGGIFLQNSGNGLTIEDSTISNNTTTSSGGGIYCTKSNIDATKVTISDNIATGYGGGIYMKENSTVNMTNSNIVDNTAGNYGGGVFLGNYNSLIGNLNMNNCTLSNNKLTNTTNGVGGGIYNRLSNVSINNSIFWGNQAAGPYSAHDAYAWLGETNTFTIDHSVVKNNQNNFSTKDGSMDFAATCIDADPQFVDSNNGDYHLKSFSSAIDQGSSIGAPGDDLDGDARPQGVGIDIGSDEFVE